MCYDFIIISYDKDKSQFSKVVRGYAPMIHFFLFSYLYLFYTGVLPACYIYMYHLHA